MLKNYYQILGLENNASKDQIKKAYRIYATKFHPDKQNGDKFFEERFKEILEAYEILSDENKRKDYDTKWQNTYSQNSPRFNQNNYKKAEDDLKNERERKEREKREYEEQIKAENAQSEKYRKEKEEEQKRQEQKIKEKKSKIFYTSKKISVNGLYIYMNGQSFQLKDYYSSTIRKDDDSNFVFIGVVMIIIGIFTITFFIGTLLIAWGIYGLFYKEYFVVLVDKYGDTPLIKGRKQKMKRISKKINQAMKLK